MKKPPVWLMIKEAIESLNTQVDYADIKHYINEKWDDVKPATITAQIIALTVNHNSRIHYPENPKPRIADKLILKWIGFNNYVVNYPKLNQDYCRIKLKEHYFRKV